MWAPNCHKNQRSSTSPKLSRNFGRETACRASHAFLAIHIPLSRLSPPLSKYFTARLPVFNGSVETSRLSVSLLAPPARAHRILPAPVGVPARARPRVAVAPGEFGAGIYPAGCRTESTKRRSARWKVDVHTELEYLPEGLCESKRGEMGYRN